MNLFRTFLSNSAKSVVADRGKILKDSGHPVASFQELNSKVMELAFYNQNQIFLFKGDQFESGYKFQNTILKPSMFRPLKERLPSSRLVKRFNLLSEAEFKFIELYKESCLPNYENLIKNKLKIWSLLEHLKICSTPLLEVSDSLHMAATLASRSVHLNGVIYILEVPRLDSGITYSHSGELQIVSMASIYPPPNLDIFTTHGYMLSEYSSISMFDINRFGSDIDSSFANRVIAKFSLSDSFWKNSNPYSPISDSLVKNTSLAAIASKLTPLFSFETQ
jgi:hypothetical protein